MHMATLPNIQQPNGAYINFARRSLPSINIVF